jgi:hypothetical protein
MRAGGRCSAFDCTVCSILQQAHCGTTSIQISLRYSVVSDPGRCLKAGSSFYASAFPNYLISPRMLFSRGSGRRPEAPLFKSEQPCCARQRPTFCVEYSCGAVDLSWRPICANRMATLARRAAKAPLEMAHTVLSGHVRMICWNRFHCLPTVSI